MGMYGVRVRSLGFGLGRSARRGGAPDPPKPDESARGGDGRALRSGPPGLMCDV